MKHIFTVSLLAFALCFPRAMAADGGGDPTTQEECEDQGGVFQASDVKQLLCYFLDLPECDSTDCATCVCLIDNGVIPITYCPVSLPSPGMRVKLSLMLDKRPEIESWQIPIGFGERRPLNYLMRARIPANGESAEIYLAARTSLIAFERVEGNGEAIIYKPSDPAPSISANCRLTVIGQRAELRFPDGANWVFMPDADNPTLYTVAEMRDRWGGVTRIQQIPGQVVVTDAANQRYICHVDRQNRITSIQVHDRVWQYEYNGNSVKEIMPNGATDTLGNLPDGRFSSRTLAHGNTIQDIRFLFNPLGEVTHAQEGRVIVPAEEWEQDGVTERIITADGVRNAAVFDRHSRLLRRTIGKDGRSVTTQNRDSLGNVLASMDALGNRRHAEYDANGWMLSETSVTGEKTAYRYDDHGNRLEKTNSAGTWKYEYNDRNFLLREVNPDGAAIHYRRDERGYPTEKTDVLGNVTFYKYDHRGLLISESVPAPAGQQPSATTQYTYDDFGNMLSVTNAAG